MAKKQFNENNDLKKVKFAIDLPDAQAVYLAGSFTQWELDKQMMQRSKKGKWEKTVELPTGEYEYKFMVDGKWMEDPINESVRTNEFGTINNLLTVK